MSRKYQFLISALVLISCSVLLLIWSWETWPDILVDFGRELYVPWQLSLGKLLYVDIAYFNGPLSPYANALFFTIFGVSLNTLVFANFLLVVLLSFIISYLFSTLSNYVISTFISLIFLTVFAFGQYVGIANYNFISPYSHEITHGVFLSFLALMFFQRYLKDRRIADLSTAGFFVGLVFLTKPEVFVACSFAIAAGLYLALTTGVVPRSHNLKGITLFLLCAAVPPAVSVIVLGGSVSGSDILKGYFDMTNTNISTLPFYRRMSGLDHIANNLTVMIKSSGLYFFIMFAGGLVGYLTGKCHRNVRMPIDIALVGTLGLFSFFFRKEIPWDFVVKGYPLSLCIIILIGIFMLLRREYVKIRSPIIMFIALACFALTLLGKIILSARISNYGFALTLPATLVLSLALIQLAPRWFESRGGRGLVAQGVFGVLISVFAIAQWEVSNSYFAAKKTVVTNGLDAIRSDNRGVFVQFVLSELAGKMKSGDTLAVVPEGVMINYLLRSENPTPYINFMPPEIAMFDETVILKKFAESPPDFIAVVHKDTSEYGYRFFGKDYGRDIYSWIFRNYTPFRLIGAPPLQSDYFGIALLQKKAEG